jgi:hypothetical protein
LGENPILNDKASAIYNASYATGCVLGPIIGSELFESYSTFDGAEVVVSGFPQVCDVMALAASCFCVVYFFVNIVPYWFMKTKKPVAVSDIEKAPLVVSLDNSKSQLIIENVGDEDLAKLKGVSNDKSITNG